MEFQENRSKKAKYESIKQTSKDVKEEKCHHLDENIWEEIYQSVSDWIFLTDSEGKIIKTNKAGEIFTGLSCEEITGQTCCKLVHNFQKHIKNCPIAEIKLTGQQAISEYYFQMENGFRKKLIQ